MDGLQLRIRVKSDPRVIGRSNLTRHDVTHDGIREEGSEGRGQDGTTWEVLLWSTSLGFRLP